jgi:hypothetical protein
VICKGNSDYTRFGVHASSVECNLCVRRDSTIQISFFHEFEGFRDHVCTSMALDFTLSQL